MAKRVMAQEQDDEEIIPKCVVQILLFFELIKSVIFVIQCGSEEFRFFFKP